MATNSDIGVYLGLSDEIYTAMQTAQGSSWTAAANEFLDALFNKLVYQRVTKMGFQNPFRKYDSFPVNYGTSIENIFVELPQGYAFDKDATNPFAKNNPSVKSLYAVVNYEQQYKNTIQDVLLRRACLNEYGFQNLVDSIVSTLSTAKSIDEYYATISMLDNPAIYASGITSLTKSTDAGTNAKLMMRTIADTISHMVLPSKSYNAMGVLTATNPSDILLVIKADILNDINFDFLSGVYNLSKVDLKGSTIVVDDFKTPDKNGELQGNDIDFAVIDTAGFDNHVALEDSGMIYNPEGKYTNHYTNLWKIISYKYFHNAKAFVLKESN